MNSKNEFGVFFISGAGLNKSIWDEVIASLSVPCAVADHSSARRANASLKDYVDADEEQALTIPAKRLVIVAHSIGGVIGVELLRRLGDRAAGFIAVSAAIPLPGKSFTSTLPFPQNIATGLIIRAAGTKPPEAMIRKALCNDLTEGQADEVVRGFMPESVMLYTDSTSRTMIPEVRSLYVETTNDQQSTTALQLTMSKRLPNSRTAPIASGHLPMMSHGKELSGILEDFIAGL